MSLGSRNTDSSDDAKRRDSYVSGSDRYANFKNLIHIEFQLQHGGEIRNRYEDLLQLLLVTNVMHIYALNPDPVKNPKSTRRASLVSETGYIEQTKSIVPPLFSLAVAEVCWELGLHSFSMRTTTAAIISLLNSPKPPEVKYKTLKGGFGDATISFDTSVATQRTNDNIIIPLEQNKKYEPALNHDIGLTQQAFPLEKFIIGLQGDKPEFTIMNSEEEIKKTGIILAKVNVKNPNPNDKDPEIGNTLYRIDLNELNKSKPLASDQGRISPAIDMQPSWWNESFGTFKDVVKCGYHIDYKKPTDTDFHPYLVYARKTASGEMAVITGDQDNFSTPRSTKYDLGQLAIQEVDTKEIGGTRELISKLYDVHKIILKQDTAQLEQSLQMEFKNNNPNQDPAQGQALIRHKINDFITQKSIELTTLLESSESYIHGLGNITPYEAYVFININLREQKLKEDYALDPEQIMDKVKQVHMTSSIGLKHILDNKAHYDVDLNPGWFSKKQDPQGCVEYINYQLKSNRHVSGLNLSLYMDTLKNDYVDSITSLQKTQHHAIIQSSREAINLSAKVALSLNHMIKTNKPPCEIYIKDTKGNVIELNQNNLLKNPRDVSEILIVTKENNAKQVIQMDGNTIHSTAENGQEHIKNILKAASISSGKNDFEPIPKTIKPPTQAAPEEKENNIINLDDEISMRPTH